MWEASSYAPAAHQGGDRYEPEVVDRIRVASQLAATALTLILESAKPGMTTDELDANRSRVPAG